MAIGPINNFPLVPVSTGQRQAPAPQSGDDGRPNRAESATARSQFVQELQAVDPNREQLTQQRQKPVALEEISANLPRGSILDITV